MRARIVLLYSLLRLVEVGAVFLAACGRWFQAGLDDSGEGREAVQVALSLVLHLMPSSTAWASLGHSASTASSLPALDCPPPS